MKPRNQHTHSKDHRCVVAVSVLDVSSSIMHGVLETQEKATKHGISRIIRVTLRVTKCLLTDLESLRKTVGRHTLACSRQRAAHVSASRSAVEALRCVAPTKSGRAELSCAMPALQPMHAMEASLVFVWYVSPSATKLHEAWGGKSASPGKQDPSE